MPVDTRTWHSLESAVLGETASAQDAASLERQITDHLNTLEQLYRRLKAASLNLTGRRTDEEVVRDLKANCPRCHLSASGGATLAGTDSSFTVSASCSPFSIFDNTGKCFAVTVPVQSMAIKVGRRGITSFTMHGSPWQAVARSIPEDARIVKNRAWGHPHCSVQARGINSFTTNSHHMCFGYNNDRLGLAESLNSQAKLVLCIKGLYAWLTELNVDSMFHRNTSPITCEQRYLMGTITPACAAGRADLLELVRSDGYSRTVDALRSGRASAADLGEFAGMVNSAISRVQPFAGTLVAENLAQLLAMNPRAALLGGVRRTLGLHQLVGSCLVLGAPSVNMMSSCIVNSASTALATLGKVWTMDSLGDYLGGGVNAMPTVELKRFLADYETMREGTYERGRHGDD